MLLEKDVKRLLLYENSLKFKFWREIDLINNNQFSFLQGRSTATQLLYTFIDWAKSQNLSIPTSVIFLDLAKAFDSVPHEWLL